MDNNNNLKKSFNNSFREHLKKWGIFIKERFPLNEHLPFIIIFFLACFLFAFKSIYQHTNLSHFYNFNFLFNLVISFLTVVLVFFHLRIFDEIKDYQTDKLIHPNRPLVRGLITINQAKNLAILVIFFELFINLFLNFKTVFILSIVIFYSFLMYKEFFLREWLRKKMVLYAFLHAVIMILIPIYISFANFYQIKFDYFIFAAFNWVVSNIFEFSRKMLLPNQEGFQDSYINNLGYTKTLILHYSIIFILIFFLLYLISPVLINLFSFSILIISYFTILFSFLSKKNVSINHKVIKISKNIGYLLIFLFYLVTILVSLTGILLKK